MGRLVARGKYLFEGAEKFYVRGVSYGPFAPNSRGEEYPEPERAAADFALMRRLGANLVRLYVPPPLWMVEEAQKAGLRLMVGIPWPYHMAFLDSRDMKRDIQGTVRKTVAEMRQFGETIAAFSIGNEIRSDIVRWHGPRAVSGFLAELRDLGKQIEPDALFTYSNYPSTEYLDLSFLDFISFNVYLHREEDFRRYFTHLIGQAGELPLILSETGMDTIREGEDHQAELLAWQGQAAFELGLSGFIVFAFTDEWHRGGSEITDWAFGLTRRDRSPKPAFDAVARIFASDLPPKLAKAPKASVIVPAYNAAATLGDCLASLSTLNYPNYETILVDDGSTDSTAQIAEQGGVRTIRLEHRGLAAARNAGVEAASGDIVAFIDADARADRDWLYHLVETITRRDAAAASGPNFAPTPRSARAAAMAAAPGLPREVRAGDDRLAQLCGCNMALSKAALKKIRGFDPPFTTAGDDVDLSWRLTASGETLVYAPGAVVIHERRATLAAYLAQQRGYGRGEGLLSKRYPLRDAAEDGIYAGPSWVAAILGGARVYYGEFGRGLFQTVYSAGDSYGDLPLTIQWIAVSVVCLVLGTMNRFLGIIGGAGITITLLAAAARAASTPLPKARSGLAARIYLWILNLLGPPIRSLARERIKWRIETARSDQSVPIRATPSDSASVLAATREALIRCGLAVAETDGFQSYDLEVVVPPLIRIPINAVREKDGSVSLRWRTRIAPRRALIAAAIALLVMLAAGLPLRAACAVLILGAIAIAAFAFLRARRVSAIVERCANEITSQHHVSLAPATAGKA
jgi:hypothetical protein